MHMQRPPRVMARGPLPLSDSPERNLSEPLPVPRLDLGEVLPGPLEAVPASVALQPVEDNGGRGVGAAEVNGSSEVVLRLARRSSQVPLACFKERVQLGLLFVRPATPEDRQVLAG